MCQLLESIWEIVSQSLIKQPFRFNAFHLNGSWRSLSCSFDYIYECICLPYFIHHIKNSNDKITNLSHFFSRTTHNDTKWKALTSYYPTTFVQTTTNHKHNRIGWQLDATFFLVRVIFAAIIWKNQKKIASHQSYECDNRLEKRREKNKHTHKPRRKRTDVEKVHMIEIINNEELNKSLK